MLQKHWRRTCKITKIRGHSSEAQAREAAKYFSINVNPER